MEERDKKADADAGQDAVAVLAEVAVVARAEAVLVAAAAAVAAWCRCSEVHRCMCAVRAAGKRHASDASHHAHKAEGDDADPPAAAAAVTAAGIRSVHIPVHALLHAPHETDEARRLQRLTQSAAWGRGSSSGTSNATGTWHGIESFLCEVVQALLSIRPAAALLACQFNRVVL